MTRINKQIILGAILVVCFLLVVLFYLAQHGQKKLLIAPMIGGLDTCLFENQKLSSSPPGNRYAQLCMQDKESPSALINEALKGMGDAGGEKKYALGYTFYVPLLKLFDLSGADVVINREAVQRIASTIKNTNRPVVVYLFSDHFSVGSPLEAFLSKQDDNLLQTRGGLLPVDQYYGSKIYPWSFVNTKNEITRLREVAFNAVLDEVCTLPTAAIQRVAGVTMLGELHHLFPNFQGGMGFSGDYLITDYSQQSVEGFQEFLQARFSSIDSFNKEFGAAYTSFKAVSPPSKNIRKESLSNYLDHIDAYAHGILPISGWVAQKLSKTPGKDWIHVYRNGEFLARVPAAFGRQDVLAAYPDLPSSDVGWQYDMDYSQMAPGVYGIDVYLENRDKSLSTLASRKITIMSRMQSTPTVLPSRRSPEVVPLGAGILFSVDAPESASTYYFNPLVPLWHAFRKEQVTRYIKHFADIAKGKCIPPERIYSHQILPFVNPGWDETKFAVGRDLAVPADVRLGVSLYGEASYGTSFYNWFIGTHRSAYGVTEFHPLKAMSPEDLDAVFGRHRDNGAEFVSYFLDGVGVEGDAGKVRNIFSFDSRNNNAGSDVLFRSVSSLFKDQ